MLQELMAGGIRQDGDLLGGEGQIEPLTIFGDTSAGGNERVSEEPEAMNLARTGRCVDEKHMHAPLIERRASVLRGAALRARIPLQIRFNETRNFVLAKQHSVYVRSVS